VVGIAIADAMKHCQRTVANVYVFNAFWTLFGSYRTFLHHMLSDGSSKSLAEIATYTLGTWTYLYEKQQRLESPAEQQPELTLDDVLLEYLPPTHPHLPLLLGYTVALLCDYIEMIRPLLPSLVLLTESFSTRATLELLHALFSSAGTSWDDFLVCMSLSKQVGREDEYLHWLSQHMSVTFASEGLGHFLRLGRDYPSLSAAIIRGIQLVVPKTRATLDPTLESLVADLVQLICTSAIESHSPTHLTNLATCFHPQLTPLPSLTLLIHLTHHSLSPSHPLDALLPLVARTPSFLPLRQSLPSQTLKAILTHLAVHPTLSPLAISLVRDWKQQIDYDEPDSDAMESTAEFLDRIEREYLSRTEGVKWRFEEVLEEWIAEWPDGIRSTERKFPRMRNVVLYEEEEEFAGSLVKRDVPRSGLLVDSPVVRSTGGRNAVLERLDRLSGLRSTVRRGKVREVNAERSLDSFLKRLGVGGNGRARNGRRDEISCNEDADEESALPERKRRRFGDSDYDSEDSVYEDPEVEPTSSDIDELSISIEPRPLLKHIHLNRKLSSITHSSKMVVRESSPVTIEEASEDELAIQTI
jgi:hypothetical protein